LSRSSPEPPAPAAADPPVILIGSGGHARVLLDALRRLGRRVLFVTDHDPQRHGLEIDSVVVSGGDERIFEHDPKTVELVNAVGSINRPRTRREIYERFVAAGYRFATVVHPSATVAASAQLAAGVQVMAGAVIQTGASVGENALINTRSSVDHDCRIAPHVHLAPGVTLSGGVEVGRASHLGTGATVIQSIRIGREVLVAAGGVVVSDLPHGVTAKGVPARPTPGRPEPVGSAAREAGGDEPFNVMLSAAGRRVALLRLLERSLGAAGLRGQVIATDISPMTSAYQAAAMARTVPRYSDPQCLETILAFCREQQIKLIVPTIDPDLPFYTEHRARFAEVGTQVMVAPPATVRICNDKREAKRWLDEQGLPSMRQADAEQVLAANGEGWTFPLFVKPVGGSSSTGARVVNDIEELRLATSGQPYIVQELAEGAEYTVDVYVDRTGRCRCCVPRLRIETRGGEVSKGMTVRCDPVETLACRVAEALPGAWGVMNIQIFYNEQTGLLCVNEVNPRFGGGYPLSHEAGATMARWMIEEAADLPCSAQNDWRDGLVMLRYDDAVFVSRDQAHAPRTAGHEMPEIERS